MEACKDKTVDAELVLPKLPQYLNLNEAWKSYLSATENASESSIGITSPPQLSPSITTPGQSILSPATPPLPLEVLSSSHTPPNPLLYFDDYSDPWDDIGGLAQRKRKPQQDFEPASSGYGHTPSIQDAHELDSDLVQPPSKRVELDTQAELPASEPECGPTIDTLPLDSSGTETRGSFNSITKFIQYRMSISRASMASRLSVQGSRAYRWSRRISRQSLDHAQPIGCDDCPNPPPPRQVQYNIAMWLASNGPSKSETEKSLCAYVAKSIHMGASVDDRTPLGETALHIATSAGFQTICRFLLNHGANVYAVTNGNETIGEYAKTCYRATARNAARYARIKWCLSEVNKHKMYNPPADRENSPPLDQTPFQGILPPQRLQPSTNVANATKVQTSRGIIRGHRRHARTFDSSVLPPVSFGHPPSADVGIEETSNSWIKPHGPISNDTRNSVGFFAFDTTSILPNMSSFPTEYTSGRIEDDNWPLVQPFQSHEGPVQPYSFPGLPQAEPQTFSEISQTQLRTQIYDRAMPPDASFNSVPRFYPPLYQGQCLDDSLSVPEAELSTIEQIAYTNKHWPDRMAPNFF
jgi:Ankyrin repeat